MLRWSWECDIVELNKALKEGKQVDSGHSLFYYQKMKDIEQLMNKWKPAPGFESEFRIILQFVTELSFRTMSCTWGGQRLNLKARDYNNVLNQLTSNSSP